MGARSAPIGQAVAAKRAAAQERITAARRNKDAKELAYSRGQRYLREKKEHGGAREEASGQDVHLNGKTGERIAEEEGVDEKTIRRDADFATLVDEAAKKLGQKARDRGQRYLREKKDKEHNLLQNKPNGQDVHSDETTAQSIAEDYDVDEKTIRRDVPR
jgi:hypothetical protein